MGSETICILPISLFLVAMMPCVTTFDNSMDLASVLTNSTIPINDTTCSWCSHLLKGDTRAENGLVQDDQVMSDGNSLVYHCLVFYRFTLKTYMPWWMLHRGPRRGQGNLLGNWIFWPEYIDVLVYI